MLKLRLTVDTSSKNIEMTEKTLESRLVKKVKKRGGIAYKFTSPGHIGMPDRIVILPNGKIGFVEVKKPGYGILSKVQENIIKKLMFLGCKCFILDDPNRIEEILDNIEV